MAKKEKEKKKDKKKDKDKKFAKGLKDKKYYAVKACGKKFSLKAPIVWEKGWKEIVSVAQSDEEELFQVAYACEKCSRLSPTKYYLCKPKKLKS